MDRPRLVIGNNIIDSVEDASNSTSTITGAIFEFGNRDDGLISEESPTAITSNFTIVVNVDSQADLNQRVQDVLDALDEMRSEGVEIESDVGERVFFIDPAAVESVAYSTTKEWGFQSCTISVDLEITPFDSSQFGKARWQYNRNSSGRAFIVGTIIASTRAAAVAVAAPLRAGTARPVWMPDSCRVVSDLNEFEMSSGDIGTLPDTSYRPGEISVTFEQLPAWMASNSAFDDIRRGEFKFSARLEKLLNIRAGNLPGLAVEVRGMVEFKTESSTDYDVADTTTVAAGGMKGKVVAMANAAVAQAETRLGESITLLEPLERSVTGEDGVYEFIVVGITGNANQVIEWDEQETYVEAFRGQIVNLADGGDFEFEHPGGDEVSLRHTVRIVSLNGSRDYPQPQTSLRNMRRTLLEDDPVQILRADSTLPKRHEKIYRRSYTRVNKGGAGGGGGRATSSGFGPQIGLPGQGQHQGHVGPQIAI